MLDKLDVGGGDVKANKTALHEICEVHRFVKNENFFVKVLTLFRDVDSRPSTWIP